jgi:hypothetical protein
VELLAAGCLNHNRSFSWYNMQEFGWFRLVNGFPFVYNIMWFLAMMHGTLKILEVWVRRSFIVSRDSAKRSTFVFAMRIFLKLYFAHV